MNVVTQRYRQRQMKQLLGQNHSFLTIVTLLWLLGYVSFVEAHPSSSRKLKEAALEQFENHCFDCHDGEAKKGDLDLSLIHI